MNCKSDQCWSFVNQSVYGFILQSKYCSDHKVASTHQSMASLWQQCVNQKFKAVHPLHIYVKLTAFYVKLTVFYWSIIGTGLADNTYWSIIGGLRYHHIISVCQFGFPSLFSTESALLSVTHFWSSLLDSHKSVCATFFDLRKALTLFRTVPFLTPLPL